MENILPALISGVLTLIGVIVSSMATNRNMNHRLDKQQTVTEIKLDELTREVREHNNFAQRVPIIEEQIKGIFRRLEKVEGGDTRD